MTEAKPKDRLLTSAEVARRGGHAPQSITLDTYSHVITERDDYWPVAWETYGSDAVTE